MQPSTSQEAQNSSQAGSSKHIKKRKAPQQSTMSHELAGPSKKQRTGSPDIDAVLAKAIDAIAKTMEPLLTPGPDSPRKAYRQKQPKGTIAPFRSGDTLTFVPAHFDARGNHLNSSTKSAATKNSPSNIAPNPSNASVSHVVDSSFVFPDHVLENDSSYNHAIPATSPRKSRSTAAKNEATSKRWSILLPQLLPGYGEYLAQSLSCSELPESTPTSQSGLCLESCRQRAPLKVTCLYRHRTYFLSLLHCRG